MNTYAYVGGNPLIFTDPEGLRGLRNNSRFGSWAPPPGQAVTNLQVNILRNRIRRYDPAFSYSTVRPSGPRGRYNRSDVASLQQSLNNAQSSGFCGPGASQLPNFMRNGQVSQSNLEGIIPRGVPNTWRSSEQLPSGFRYRWSNNGVNFEAWGHGPNPTAPQGSYSRSNPTMTLRVNRRTVTSTGTTVRNARSEQNAPLVHIPLVP